MIDPEFTNKYNAITATLSSHLQRLTKVLPDATGPAITEEDAAHVNPEEFMKYVTEQGSDFEQVEIIFEDLMHWLDRIRDRGVRMREKIAQRREQGFME